MNLNTLLKIFQIKIIEACTTLKTYLRRLDDMVMTNYKLCKWKIRVLKNCILVGKYQILQTKKYKVFLNHKIVYSSKKIISKYLRYI